jgi:putative membrane protein
MTLRWIFAALHLLALGIGLGAVWTRARALRALPEPSAFGRVFAADGAWGGAFVLWLGTGLMRAFGGLEKGTTYYLQNSAFHLKMGLLVLITLLEIWPAVTLVRWRIARKKGVEVDTRARGPAGHHQLRAGRAGDRDGLRRHGHGAGDRLLRGAVRAPCSITPAAGRSACLRGPRPNPACRPLLRFAPSA